MNWLSGLLLVFTLVLGCLAKEAHVKHKTCEQECSTTKPAKLNKILYDVHCHRGCRLFRIIYMLTSPWTGQRNIEGECSKSCEDSYTDNESQKACRDGCQYQQKRFVASQKLHSKLPMDSHSLMPQDPFGAHFQTMQRYLSIFRSLNMDHHYKRLCTWTLISSNNSPRILIFKAEHVMPHSGHFVMADAAPHSELQLGGAQSGTKLDTAAARRKQHDMWWICVIERTLQPLMAGLLLLSVLILLWLCFTSTKDAPAANQKELVIPDDMADIKFLVHNPQCGEITQEEKSKAPLLKVPLENV